MSWLKQYPQGSNEQKVADLYASYMDTDRLEQLGLEALQQDLQRIESIKTKKIWQNFCLCGKNQSEFAILYPFLSGP